MFNRFTHRARLVVVWAQEEARELNSQWIGTEHILLGLVSESEGVDEEEDVEEDEGAGAGDGVDVEAGVEVDGDGESDGERAVDGDGVATQIFKAIEITPEAVRTKVEEAIGAGTHYSPVYIPLSPGAKKSLELALREAVQLGHHHIGTGHILLGLMREGKGVAAQVLAALGADFDEVRKLVTELSPMQHPGPTPQVRRRWRIWGR